MAGDHTSTQTAHHGEGTWRVWGDGNELFFLLSSFLFFVLKNYKRGLREHEVP
jgi:hypothetical protein